MSLKGVCVEVNRQGEAVLQFTDQLTSEVYESNRSEWHKAFKQYVNSNKLPIKSLRFVTYKEAV